MDELMQLKEAINTLKETVIFLVEQEKIRGSEVSALNEKIDSVNDTVVNKIINPVMENYNQYKYNEFNDNYGERLGKFNETLKSSMNDPDYDAVKEAWDTYNEIPEEDKADIDLDAYVDDVEKGLTDYVSNIKKSLGISEETPVEITETDGTIEVKTDENGDGKPETTVATEEETKEEETTDEKVEEKPSEENEDKEPTEEEMAAWLNGSDLKK